jgi:hypothetical protein
MSKPTARTSTVARVTITLEVEVGSWGPECDLAQVYRQGSESALGKIRAMIGNSGYGANIRIVKAGPVEALTTTMNMMSVRK